MEAGEKQAPPNPDVQNRQPGLGNRGELPQADAHRDHNNHQRIAGPLLEGEDAYLFLEVILYPADVPIREFRENEGKDSQGEQ